MPPARFARLMRLNAAVLLLALPTVFFPPAVVRRMHAGFGLGPFPESPLTEYLTRSAALCYTLHGLVIWSLASDVARYLPLVRRVYRLHLLFAAGVAAVGAYSGLPAWWVLAEAGTIAGVATLMLRLCPEER